MVTAKIVAPAAINALKEALTHVYWYKSDLRSFLMNTIGDPGILSRVNWDDLKRNIVRNVVDYLARNQGQYQGDLPRLMSEVARMDDFTHLKRLEDGDDKARKARDAVGALRKHVASHDQLVASQEQSEERRAVALRERMRSSAVRERLDDLQQRYFHLLTLDPQRRGYDLEPLMKDLFDLFDLDPRASFKLAGEQAEQIDGAFSFEGTDFLFEAKWEDPPTGIADLDAFDGKVSRKLENTLGLFLSINGFSNDAVRTHSKGRPQLILMDGSDLMAVLEGRIDLVQLLLRKRRHASQTGNIYLRIHDLF